VISKLEPNLEGKPLFVAKRHDLLCGGWGLFLLGVPAIALQVVNSRHPLAHPVSTKVVLVGLVVEFALLFAGLFCVLKYEEQLCIQIGFVCPYSAKPLSVARKMRLLEGICRKTPQKPSKCTRAIFRVMGH
jgi:hypothetical protein